MTPWRPFCSRHGDSWRRAGVKPASRPQRTSTRNLPIAVHGGPPARGRVVSQVIPVKNSLRHSDDPVTASHKPNGLYRRSQIERMLRLSGLSRPEAMNRHLAEQFDDRSVTIE